MPETIDFKMYLDYRWL